MIVKKDWVRFKSAHKDIFYLCSQKEIKKNQDMKK